MSDSWHILGAGSIGGLFAHRLSRGGASVKLLTRNATETERSLRLTDGSRLTDAHFDCDWIGHSSPIKYLLITTKSWAAKEALSSIQHRLTDDSVVVAMMNGMQHVDDLKALVPANNLVLASTTAGCHRRDGTWMLAGEGKTIIGSESAHPEPPWLICWQRGVPNLSWQLDMRARLIEKLAINACINPLTALYRISNGALLSAQYRSSLQDVICEVSDIVKELGHDQLAVRLSTLVHQVVEDTATNTSSMLSDVLAGRRTESDAILGWLLNHSRKPRPKLQALATQLRQLEQNQ